MRLQDAHAKGSKKNGNSLAFRKYPHPQVVLYDCITSGWYEEWKIKTRWTKRVCWWEDGVEGEEKSQQCGVWYKPGGRSQ